MQPASFLLCLLLFFSIATSRTIASNNHNQTVVSLSIKIENPSSDLNVINIPLKRAGRLFLIEAKIDDQIGNLVFDTGATGLVVNKTYFRKYSGPTKTTGGVTGSINQVRSTVIDSIDFSGIYYHNVEADIANLGHIEDRRGVKIIGLLGLSMIDDFEIILNASKDLLILHKIDKDGNCLDNTAGKIKFDFTHELRIYKHMMSIKAIVAEKEFELSNYSNAKKVFLAGSFNNWRPNYIKMLKSGSSWKIPVFLPEGTHLYKYVVDNQWITDPSNPDIKTDAFGNQNSIIAIGDTVIFKLPGFIDAKSVVLTGSFNNWSRNELPMYRVAGGWELPYVLGAGTYEYKFIVDGRWFTDPVNPNITGKGEFTNSVLTFKPNHTFRLGNFPDAKKVIVAGSFNNWDQKAFQMTKVNGVWEFPINLRPGKYTYKFIVDESWMLDPANPNWEDNEYGTGNSVLWIEP